MFKSAKSFTVVGILIIVALVVGLYISSKNAANQEPITIYQTATPIKSTKVSKNIATVTKTSSEVSTLREQFHEHAMHVHISDGTGDFSVNELEREAPLSEETEAPKISGWAEESDPNDFVDEDFDAFQQVHEQIERLASQIQAEYPELLELQNMTIEEMESLSTEEKRKISELSQQFQAEYMPEIHSLFSQFPPEHLENILFSYQEKYKQQWGSELTDQILAETQNLLE